MLYITDVLVDKLLETENNYTSNYNENEKKKLLEYLKKFKASMFTSAPVVDVFTGSVVADADNGYSDGRYTWYKSEVYYFEKYNLKLNDNFVRYVLK